MAVDKNLFMYDLAIVAIIKNEAPYLNEWLDYHLLAGVDHFYLYDNDSTDNTKDILQPYIDAGIVTYKFYPGKVGQYAAYNDAIYNQKFLCRYIAFIDADEFIFPQSNRSIVEVTDEILLNIPQTVALCCHWNLFGSSYHDTADYARGVMQRFIHRAQNDYAPIGHNGFPDGNSFVKTIANPRYISYCSDAHNMHYFEGKYSVDETGRHFPIAVGLPVVTDKIRVNHYVTKSREEYIRKCSRGHADKIPKLYNADNFKHDTPTNEIFDDSILDYVKARCDAICPAGGGVLENLAPQKKIDNQRILNHLIQNLSPTFGNTVSLEYFAGKMESFLTCLTVSTYLKNNFISEKTGNFLEEISLEAINRTFEIGIEIADIRLFLSALPNILMYPYPVVDEIRTVCINLIPQLMNFFRVNMMWKEYTEMNYLMNMLKVFEAHDKK